MLSQHSNKRPKQSEWPRARFYPTGHSRNVTNADLARAVHIFSKFENLENLNPLNLEISKTCTSS